MRTTLAIDDDVLQSARVLAARDGRTLGEVISALARAGLERPRTGGERNGILLLATGASAEPVTTEFVNALRDEEP